jgi:hypothetical protein
MTTRHERIGRGRATRGMQPEIYRAAVKGISTNSKMLRITIKTIPTTE